MNSGTILLADDEPAFQRLAASWLKGAGFEVIAVGDGEAARQAFEAFHPDVVLLDLAMPPHFSPEAGLSLIEVFPGAPVVVITGHADRELALKAVEAGAWDFLAKPLDPDLLRVVVGRALHRAGLERELRLLRAREEPGEMGIAGTSAPIALLRDMIRRIGPTNLPVLILGPSGTGKELVARALHGVSNRQSGPFVPVHCGAIPGELLESELFGHLKGSFTGAHADRPGLVETARGGTLFLDEIGEMPLAMQVKLLRFLQEGTFLPVGGRDWRKSDVRIVAATNRDLQAMVREGSFREDLYYRLKGMVLRTPALDERPGDVSLLAALFLRRAAAGRPAHLAPQAAAWLSAQNWPGNVRELQTLVECAAALAAPGEGGELVIRSSDLDFARTGIPPSAPAMAQTLDQQIEVLERRLIVEALETTGHNNTQAARLLGISRMGLLKKLDRLGLRNGGGHD